MRYHKPESFAQFIFAVSSPQTMSWQYFCSVLAKSNMVILNIKERGTDFCGKRSALSSIALNLIPVKPSSLKVCN